MSLKSIRFLYNKLAQAAPPTHAPSPEPPSRPIPEIKGALPHEEPYYPDGNIPQHRNAIRMMPPVGKMPPKPPGANRKK